MMKLKKSIYKPNIDFYRKFENKHPSKIKKAITKKTKCIFLESPSNPTKEIIDIQSGSKIAHHHNALVIVDNILASPVLQKPLELEADIVVYSGTKHIDGQGIC